MKTEEAIERLQEAGGCTAVNDGKDCARFPA